jgi:hypothetical protein
MALLLLELEFRWWAPLTCGVWYNWACFHKANNEIYAQGFEVELFEPAGNRKWALGDPSISSG